MEMRPGARAIRIVMGPGARVVQAGRACVRPRRRDARDSRIAVHTCRGYRTGCGIREGGCSGWYGGSLRWPDDMSRAIYYGAFSIHGIFGILWPAGGLITSYAKRDFGKGKKGKILIDNDGKGRLQYSWI